MTFSHDIDYFDALPQILREWIWDSSIVGMLSAQEVHLLNQTFGPGMTLILLQAREAMEIARHPQFVPLGPHLPKANVGPAPSPRTRHRAWHEKR